MSKILQFPEKGVPRNSRGPSIGLILIEASATGETIAVTGSFQRGQSAVYALNKAMTFVMEKIARSGSAGYTPLPPINEPLSNDPPLPIGLTQTDFMGLQ